MPSVCMPYACTMDASMHAGLHGRSKSSQITGSPITCACVISNFSGYINALKVHVELDLCTKEAFRRAGSGSESGGPTRPFREYC